MFNNYVRNLILVAAFLYGCGQQDNKPASVKPSAGGLIYRQYCISCHGADGTMGANGAPNLATSILSEDETIGIISNGRKGMMPFKEVLSEDEIRSVAKSVAEMRQNSRADAE